MAAASGVAGSRPVSRQIGIGASHSWNFADHQSPPDSHFFIGQMYQAW